MLDGDRATGECYTIAHHLFTADGARQIMLASLRYLDTYAKLDGKCISRSAISSWTGAKPAHHARDVGSTARSSATATTPLCAERAAATGRAHEARISDAPTHTYIWWDARTLGRSLTCYHLNRRVIGTVMLWRQAGAARPTRQPSNG